MRMTVLIENDAPAEDDGLVAELGLSLLFEVDGTLILFDTGASGAFADNAAHFGVDIGAIDLAVISHHHFDHGGGLATFFELNDHAHVYLRQAPHADRYFRFLGRRRPIGIDLELFENYPDRIIEVTDSTEIRPGVTLVTEMGSDHPRPRGNRRLFVEKNGRLATDKFDHELTMVLHDGNDLVVVTGCSHSGVLNMIDAAAARFPDRKVRAIVGGFHLIGLPFYDSMAASRREVEALGRSIRSSCDGPIFTGHCTGNRAFGILDGVLGEQLRRISTGSVAEL